jgi:hypothetical protein
MNQNALIRPDWTPATIALMVLGFVTFWPLGLAMLAYILFGERLKSFKRDANASVDTVFSTFKGGFGKTGFTRGSFRTGNVAFDDWREAELARLDEERRRLDDMREDFDAYVRELRRAKDQDDFNRFMDERKFSHERTSGMSNGPVTGYTGN